MRNAAGDVEYRVRVNNTGERGEQQVRSGRDDDRDGRIDTRDDDIETDWSADGKSGSDPDS